MTEKKVSFTTLGCRYNRMETAEMAHDLRMAGYRQAAEGDGPADVVVINSCAVTHRSAAKSRAAIRDAVAKHPGAKVVVTGCYPQTDPKGAAGVEGVALALGNAEKRSLASALMKLEEDASAQPLILAGADPAQQPLPVRPVTAMEGRTNVYVNAQSGCDEICSFCVVRVARGSSRSAPAGALAEQARRLAEAGVGEMVISGINVGQYRDGEMDLAGLLELVLKESDIPRVRLSSINPNEVTERLMELMAAEPRLMPHLHVPLQSGSDRILSLMRRPYTAEKYERLLYRLAEMIPGIGLGADVMTAFPGETEEDHIHTRALIERLPLMMLHVFSYSKRQGTEAAGLPGAVKAEDSRRRTNELKAVSAGKRERFMAAHAGKRLSILVESERTASGALKGFTQNYIPAALEGPDSARGRIVTAVGERALDGRLFCRME